MAPESFFFFVKENQFIFMECNSIFGSFTCVIIELLYYGGVVKVVVGKEVISRPQRFPHTLNESYYNSLVRMIS